jgi:hypothetical protein
MKLISASATLLPTNFQILREGTGSSVKRTREQAPIGITHGKIARFWRPSLEKRRESQQISGRSQRCTHFGTVQSGASPLAQSCGPRFFRMGIPKLRKPSTSVTGWPEGLGKHIEESWASVLPNLLPASHVCLAIDQRRSGRHSRLPRCWGIHQPRSSLDIRRFWTRIGSTQ